MNFSKDKHIIIPLVIAFAAVVGFRTWRDMHPPPKAPSTAFGLYYAVKSDAALAPFEKQDDNRALIIWVGDIETGKDGALSLKSTPVTPVTLAQREIVPYFTLDKAPASASDLAKIISGVVDKWNDEGDIINDVYIDGPKDTASLGKLLETADELHGDLHDSYWIGLFADRKALAGLPDRQTKLEEASKSMRTVILSEKEAIKPNEKLADLITNLDHETVLPFVLEVDAKPDTNALSHALRPAPERFAGLLLDKPDDTHEP